MPPNHFTTEFPALEHSDEKTRIAKKAVDLIAEAGCLVLDAGTTTLTVARLLYPTKPLRVITDSIEIAYGALLWGPIPAGFTLLAGTTPGAWGNCCKLPLSASTN